MPHKTALTTYLSELVDIRGPGVKETSFYPALSNLLNTVGSELRPKVKCVIHPSGKGAGLPDGGLFTQDQIKTLALDEGTGWEGVKPERGVLEAKGASENLDKLATSEQVSKKYLNAYSTVLITNLREFALVVKNADGKPQVLERYSLAADEKSFWRSADQPHKASAEHGERFTDFLKRALLHKAQLRSPQDVAWFLASYAREAKVRLEKIADAAPLNVLRNAFETALGITFSDEKGEHFFRSAYVQTLFYGVFSAWTLWHKENPARVDIFDWRLSSFYLRVAVMQALFGQVAQANTLRELNLIETLDWTGIVLNRVERSAFFDAFEAEHALQYFYEPFLKEFDPDLRKSLGVWYTPPEIVKYMVARVDATLRNDLGIANGLADERVVVLDPCCGTGAYLVEVLHHIARTLRQNGDDALMGNDLKRAATQRVFGFELLPAPFVIAHLQMGLLLQSLSAPLADSERAGVYLTNALTGWEPPKDPKTQLTLLPELQRERDAAEQVKRNRKILVVLGNPPYDGYAGMAIGEERTLSDAYRTTQRASKPQGQGLNELYVRFFRMAERRIVEQSGEGVICFISNYSWLEGESHPGMREKYLEVFDRITIDCLNGDKYKTGKQTPTGAPDPSMFSTELNKEGIQVGTAIALLVRKTQHSPANTVQFRHLWGKQKRAQLLAEATQAADSPAPAYETLTPALALGLPFKPAKFEAAYPAWPLLTELFPVSFPGVKTSRDEFLVDVDHDALVQRMAQYFDGTISHAEMRRLAPSIMESTTRYDAEATRAKLQKRGLLPQNIVRYSYRPFDTRWLYWEPEGKLLDEKRADYFPQVFEGNVWIASAQNNRKDFDPPVVLSTLGSLHVIERGANLFPLYLQQEATLLELATRKPNISETLAAYLAQHNASAEEAFFHIVAVLHAPQYRTDNAGALRQDWPRISLPTGRALLQASAALGRQVAALLNTEQPVSGLTAGPIQAVYKDMAVIQRTSGGQLRPEEGDLSVTANWGHRGQGNAVMPGRGDVRPSNDGRLDVYLNDVAYWHNLPSAVWEYTIGGYQVIKKWLSYREQSVLGRALKTEEVREVTHMARRIAALIALQPQLDANYAICKT